MASSIATESCVVAALLQIREQFHHHAAVKKAFQEYDMRKAFAAFVAQFDAGIASSHVSSALFGKAIALAGENNTDEAIKVISQAILKTKDYYQLMQMKTFMFGLESEQAKSRAVASGVSSNAVSSGIVSLSENLLRQTEALLFAEESAVGILQLDISSTHFELAKSFRRENDLNSALIHAFKAVEITLRVLEEPYQLSLGPLYIEIAELYESLTDNSNAFVYYEKARETYKSIEDQSRHNTLEKLKVQRLMLKVQRMVGDKAVILDPIKKEKCEEKKVAVDVNHHHHLQQQLITHLKTITSADLKVDESHREDIAKFYILLSKKFVKQNNFKQAILYSLDALRQIEMIYADRKKLGDKLAETLVVIAELYESAGEKDWKANTIHYYTRARETYIEIYKPELGKNYHIEIVDLKMKIDDLEK